MDKISPLSIRPLFVCQIDGSRSYFRNGLPVFRSLIVDELSSLRTFCMETVASFCGIDHFLAEISPGVLSDENEGGGGGGGSDPGFCALCISSFRADTNDAN